MNQVMNGLADERVARELRPEKVVAIDNRAAGAGEAVGPIEIVEPSQRFARREHRGGARDFGNLHANVGRGEVRVAPQVAVVEHIVP